MIQLSLRDIVSFQEVTLQLFQPKASMSSKEESEEEEETEEEEEEEEV